jgi:hypothetical protein
MDKFSLNEFGELDIDNVNVDELNVKQKNALARKIVILLLDGYYKDQIEAFTDYVLDAWTHEGWGRENLHRDIAELLNDAEMSEEVIEILKATE